MPIIRNGFNPGVKGLASTFTGSVRVETPFAAIAPGRVAGAIVTFEPGARSAWHTHPLGQVEVMHPGDIVQCPPNVRHWHGATPTTSCTHIAIAEWMEHVTDEQYRAGEASR